LSGFAYFLQHNIYSSSFCIDAAEGGVFVTEQFAIFLGVLKIERQGFTFVISLFHYFPNFGEVDFGVHNLVFYAKVGRGNWRGKGQKKATGYDTSPT
jgi:hypothetical protein